MPAPTVPPLKDYPLRTTDKLRYGDTDQQGHINNAVYTTFFETGRVELIYSPTEPLADAGAYWVIARLVVDFLREVTWPGTVEIGTAVSAIGSSSVTLEQAVFQGDVCVAKGESIIVQVDHASRKSRPLSEATRARLRRQVRVGVVLPEPSKTT